MAKHLKGMVQDTTPDNQPEGSYFFGKNGIQYFHRGSIENEPGFTISAARIPYGIPMGVIETDFHPVIFSTNNVNSAVSYYDEVNEVIIPILDDASLGFKLGFSTDFYITGQAQRNYKGEVVVTFTDKRPPPRYLNCDNPNVHAPEDLLLFPLAQAPTITLTQDSGGVLLPGSYFAGVRYLKNDGTQTAFLVLSDPSIVAGATGVPQNTSLIVQLTNVDPNYNIAEVAIIQKVNGVFTAYLLAQVQLAPITTIVYTGSNPTTPVTLDEVLKNPVVYQQIGTMGQLNDYLYNGNLEGVPEINMQQYANLVTLKWRSELHSVFPSEPDITTGKKRSFMHREVYAVYIQYSLTTGGWSRAFTLPGRVLLPADLANSTQAITGAGLNVPKFKVEDTIPAFDPVSGTGIMGAWQNAGETYPNTDDYNSTAIGGLDLRGQPVRHHRFPSLRWCKQNLYQFNADYGRSKMDILGVDVTNVVIPTQYAGIITGYRILYAKRNLGNSTIAGQSLFLQGSRTADDNGNIIGGDTNYISTGGNWYSVVDFKGTANDKKLAPDYRLVRFHAFDILFNQPAIQPSYICQELYLQRTNMSPTDLMEDGDFTGTSGKNAPLVYLIDYLAKGLTPTAAADDKVFRLILSSTYVPNNLVNGPWNNVQQETCFGMVTGGGPVLSPGEWSFSDSWVGNAYVPPDKVAQFEKTYLSNLMFLRDNLYVAFTSQTLVIANSRTSGAGNTTLFGGDAFISEYTFHTYGWEDSQNRNFGDGDGTLLGIRAARRFICESSSNINLRFVTPGNQYSEWYPEQPLVKDDINNYLTLFKRTSDPNQFGYSKDLNALNELVSSAIFDPLVEVVFKFPYRIHRSGKLGRLDKRRSWRTFDPLDFYEMQKNMGFIANLEGQDDRLIIHTEKAMFLTQDKTQLESNVLSITLGSGDIFQFEPQEGLSAKLGYAGTQHDLACVRTPIGYVFIDSLQGQIFMFKGKLQLANSMMNTFLLQFARIAQNNPFTGNGYTIGYDPHFRRLLITAKNKRLATSTTVPVDFQATPEFIATLTPGVSIVRKDGRLERFLGVNQSPTYSCDAEPVPVMQNYIISVADNTIIGTQVLAVAGINVDNVYILSGNTGPAWALTASGLLSVNGALDFHTLAQYILNCTAVNNDGLSTNFTITIHIVAANKPPATGDQTVHINAGSPVGTIATQVLASDPEGQPLTYTITAGNTGNAFLIEADGTIKVQTQAQIDININPSFTLTIAVSDGTNTVNATITIIVDYVNTPPSTDDVVVTIPDTTPDGTLVADLQALVYDQGVRDGLETMSFTIVTESVAGVFDVPLSGQVTLVANSALNPLLVPQYILTLRATDTGNPAMASIFRLIINITYDPGTLAFVPAQGTCTGGGCPAGWVLSPDGTQCLRTTTIDATPPSGPQIETVRALNGAYTNFGFLLYQPGYAMDGTGTIQQLQASDPWWNPANDLVNGALNRCALWGATAVPDNTPIGFSIPVFLPAPKTYLIGMGADNKMKVTINGTTIIDQDPTAMKTSIISQFPAYAGNDESLAFKFWHVYPVTLPAGNNYIGLEGVNFGGPAGFGAEIYDNTLAELQAAILDPAYVANPDTFPQNGNFYTNLNLIFSTRMARGEFFTSGVTNAYTCPATYGLDPTQTPPKCILTESMAAAATAKTWAKVSITSTRLAMQVALLNNQSTPVQDFAGIQVPYYPNVANHVDCGGAVHTFLSVQKSGVAAKEGCTPGLIGSLVTYYVQAGKYMGTVDQPTVDATAQTDVNTNKQTYADANGTCN